MHYINSRNRQKRCIREDKSVAMHTVGLSYIPILAGQSQFWQKFRQKSKTNSMCRPLSFLFFPRSLVFRDKNHEIRK